MTQATITQTDFSRYARQYDDLLRYKPSYHEVLRQALGAISERLAPDGVHCIGDFGAGTGSLTRMLAEAFPRSMIQAVDFNASFVRMLEEEAVKYPNIQVVQGDVETRSFPDNHFDAIAMIHVLRLTDNAHKGRAIQAAHDQLKEGGYLVIADIGRKLNRKRHGWEIFQTARREIGLWGTASLFMRTLDAVRFNAKCARMERIRPENMLHTLDEFCKRIESTGFAILEARDDLYLGDDDFVVARKEAACRYWDSISGGVGHGMRDQDCAHWP